MLATLLIWLYLIVLTLLYGSFCIHLLRRFSSLPHDITPSPAVGAVLGLGLITTLAGFLSLFISLSWLANLAFLLGAAAILVFTRKPLARTFRAYIEQLRSIHPLAWLCFAAIFLFVLAKTADQPLNYDTGLYHAQAIRWIEEYPVVPGLGNLFRNLAYNSSWFLPSALTSFSFLGLGSFHVLDGFLFLIFLLYCTQKFSGLMRGENSISNISGALLLFLSRWLFGLELSSPGTDLPAALLAWLIFMLGLEMVEEHMDRSFNLMTAIPVCLSVYALTIKLILIPILLIPLVLIVWNAKQLRKTQLAAALLSAALIGLPWAIRSIIQSGYLVYPFHQLDLFKVEWKIPRQHVIEDVEGIYSWPKIPNMDKNIVLKMGMNEWVPIWYQAQTSNDRRLLFALGGGSLLLLAGVLARGSRDSQVWRTSGRFLFLYITGFLGAIYWFLQAPIFRYGYTYLGILICWLAAPQVQWVFKWSTRLARTGAFLIALLVLAYYGQGLYKVGTPDHIREILILQEKYPIPEVRRERLGNFEVSMPVSLDQCWYAPLPCTPIHNPEVRMLGGNLGDGFYNKFMRSQP